MGYIIHFFAHPQGFPCTKRDMCDFFYKFKGAGFGNPQAIARKGKLRPGHPTTHKNNGTRPGSDIWKTAWTHQVDHTRATMRSIDIAVAVNL